MKKSFFIAVAMFCFCSVYAQIADRAAYLENIKTELVKEWPNNRTINIVFHGHSVPTGYFATPTVNTLQAYPHLVMHGLKTHYPNAVVNVITTSIGGEQAEQGEKRFESEVLTHRPDVLFIDYALNDRGIGLERSEKAWRSMIEKALKRNIKVILLTPTPDTTENILSDDAPLKSHADMIIKLAEEYKLGLVDSYKLFYDKAEKGEDLHKYMSQNNLPNCAGHSCVASEIMTWFF